MFIPKVPVWPLWLQNLNKSFDEITDPILDWAVTTAKIDWFDWSIITLTTTWNSQTLADPTDLVAKKEFTIINNDTSTDSILINNIVLQIGKTIIFNWDWSVWTARNVNAKETSFDSSWVWLTKNNVQEQLEELAFSVINTAVDVSPLIAYKSYYVDSSVGIRTLTLPNVTAENDWQIFSIFKTTNVNDVIITTVWGTQLIGGTVTQILNVTKSGVTLQANFTLGTYEFKQDSRAKTPTSSITFYALTEASWILTYNSMATNTSDARYSQTPTDFATPSITGTDQVLANFLNDAWDINWIVNETNVETTWSIRKISWSWNANFFIEYYHRTSWWVETFLGKTSLTPTVTNASYEEFSVSWIITTKNFLVTDRFLNRIVWSKIGWGSDPVYEIQLEGLTPMRTILPVPSWSISHDSLAGVAQAWPWILNWHISNLAQDIDWVKTFLQDLIIEWDLIVNWTTTTINTETLQVEDKNIEMGNVAIPTDITADWWGITLLGATNKTIIWDNANDNWSFNQSVNIETWLEYKINNVNVLNAITLWSSVVNSSLTSVWILWAGSISSWFWNINIWASILTAWNTIIQNLDITKNGWAWIDMQQTNTNGSWTIFRMRAKLTADTNFSVVDIFAVREADGSSALTFSTGTWWSAVEGMRLTSAWNVWIGTSDPTPTFKWLHIKGTQVAIRLESTVNTWDSQIEYVDNTGVIRFLHWFEDVSQEFKFAAWTSLLSWFWMAIKTTGEVTFTNDNPWIIAFQIEADTAQTLDILQVRKSWGSNLFIIKASWVININNAPTFADDTAAWVWLLVTWDIYKNASGNLNIKL